MLAAVPQADLVVGAPGDGWRVAMATLGFERGVATLGQQVGFRRELDALITLAKDTGAVDDPALREKLVRAHVDLEVMRAHALRTLHSVTSGTPGTESSVAKLLWAHWHRALGELAMQVRGASSMLEESAEVTGGGLDEWPRLFLFTRADTIYGGSDEIQRNIIAERTLGLPREARQ